MLPTMLGVTLVVFSLCQFVPGGPIDQMRMQMAGGAGGREAGGGGPRQGGVLVSDKDLESLRKYYGFDDPVPLRYAKYLGKLVHGDLGISFRYSMPVIELIGQRLPVSIYYGAVTTFLAYLVCIPLGIIKAVRHKAPFDHISSVVIFGGYAIPGFALGAVLLALFAVRFDWFPLGGFVSEGFSALTVWGKVKDLVWHSTLPLICYLVGSFAFMTMLMKNSLMENMSADYVKTALAKGLTWRRAVFVHALRNSLIPLATSFGKIVLLILTGSLLIERVFNIQGIGLLFFEAIQARDYPVVLGLTVISAGLLLVGNLLSDLCVACVDPRVRFR
jgi:microcin C transport system permease protein